VTEASRGVVVIGAGHGGASVVGFLRQYGYEGPITLVGDEPHLPYQRPPLSKAWLKGEADTDSTALRPAEYFATHKIDLRCGVTAGRIDPVAKTADLSDGTVFPYDFLVLATGSRAIVPPIPGIHLVGIHCLRSASDAEALKAELTAGKHIAIIGGGYIGLEVAASAIALGASATVIEREDRLLARSASPQIAAFFADFQRSHGIEVRLGTSVTEFIGQGGKITAVQLADGTKLDCDVALLGVGALPNMELAQDAGLACDRGILVDEDARTSDPSIFAIGDATVRPLSPYGQRVRLESVANAVEQAKQVASAIVGRPRPAPEVTWNWSDQFDLKFQVAGLPFDVASTVVRGDVAAGKFAIFHLNQDDLVQQVEAVNAPGEFMLGKKLIAARTPVSTEQLGDISVELKALLVPA